MTVGVPREQAVEIFNELSRKVPADAEEVGRLQWRLRSLARSRSGRTTVGVALLLAELMLGNAAEAADEVGRLWPLRLSMPDGEIGIFLGELLHLGMHERAAALLRDTRNRSLERIVPNLPMAYLRVAWDSGDASQLEAIVSSPTGRELLSSWHDFLSTVNQRGIMPHLAARQKIIHEIIGGIQCFSELIFTFDDEGGELQLTHYIYTKKDYGERVNIEETIRSQLDAYFNSVSLDAANHWDLMTEVMMPITAAPSWHVDNVVREPQ